ncbi:hypothetical protein F5Y18DRAFT_439621 [Xylariaceae sp. FL1019]|nr:hypothetical protein F5Y18DRAFT_439621 [Xylariaceae sp. FL1019]
MATTSTRCIFFQRGNCKNGDSCRFSHARAPSPDALAQPDGRSRVPCKFYNQGNCNKGKACPYRHEEQPTPSSSAQPHAVSDNNTFVRVFRGALVHYGDGACVTSLRLASEYSSVRLDGLEENTTTTDVIRILEELGHDIEVDGLRVVAPPRSSTRSAYVSDFLLQGIAPAISTPDLDFSQTLSESLIDSEYHNLKAVPVPPRLPAWASTRRVRCNKLKLKWSSPRTTCHLLFKKWTTAKRVAGKFNSGAYRIGSTRVVCEELVCEVDDLAVPHIILSQLPIDTFEDLVLAYITADYDTPEYAIMGAKPAWDEEKATSSIREMLTDAGALDFMSEPTEHAGGTYWTAFASFDNDSDAQNAVRIIENEDHTLAHGLHLSAKLMYNATFKVSNEVYRHVESYIDASLVAIDAPQLHTTRRTTHTYLSIDSTSSSEIAECADAIETMVAGDVVLDKNGRPFWVSGLGINRAAHKLLAETQLSHDVLLLPNKTKREVRFFGETSKLAMVTADLIRRLTSVFSKSHIVHLDDNGFTKLFKTGFDILEALHGDKILSIDVTSNPKKLMVSGTDEQYCEVLALLDAHQVTFAAMDTKPTDDCSICFTQPDHDPVVLRCGHTYCKECFAGLCKNANTTRDLSVTCTGAEDRCKAAIKLDEIQAHIDSSALENLLELSFSTYVARRPDQFHYCPTPECGYMYRPASEAARSLEHMCPKCLKRICRSCHANHEGQSCRAWKANQAFDIYKQENQDNVKDCPKCSTTVEKIDGCNHLQCGGCKIHFCWVCLETFEEPPDCYDHMKEVHGGIGLEAEEEEEYEDGDEDDGESDGEWEDESDNETAGLELGVGMHARWLIRDR